MTTEKIIENNTLIASFMGHKQEFGDKGRWDIEMCDEFTHTTSSLKYHSSWDWLMKVVEKIENEKSANNCIVITHLICYMKTWRGMGYVELDELTQRGMTKIEAVYLFVVEYIKKYNKENKI